MSRAWEPELLAALPLPGTRVTHPLLMLLSILVLLATVLYWFGTARTPGAPQARPEETIGVEVDPVRCARFGFCEHEAPDIFQIRGEGRLTYQRRVPIQRLDALTRAVEVCPARAITYGRRSRRRA